MTQKGRGEYFLRITDSKKNQMEKVILQYNYGTLQLMNSIRDYTDGTIGGKMNTNIIYGKPDVNELTKTLFEKVIVSIKTGELNPIIGYIIENVDKSDGTVGMKILRQNM